MPHLGVYHIWKLVLLAACLCQCDTPVLPYLVISRPKGRPAYCIVQSPMFRLMGSQHQFGSRITRVYCELGLRHTFRPVSTERGTAGSGVCWQCCCRTAAGPSVFV